MSERRITRIGLTVAMVLVPVGALAIRTLGTGKSELSLCDAALSSGDAVAATVHARRAAFAYVPWAPHVDDAYARLERIARDAELRGDRESALFAWRAIRAASIGTASVWRSRDPERIAADRAIARLALADTTSRLGPTNAVVASANPLESDRRSSELASVLAGRTGPSLGWVATSAAGLGAWIGGGLYAVLRGVAPDGALSRSALFRGAALALAGVGVWCLGLVFA